MSTYSKCRRVAHGQQHWKLKLRIYVIDKDAGKWPFWMGKEHHDTLPCSILMRKGTLSGYQANTKPDPTSQAFRVLQHYQTAVFRPTSSLSFHWYFDGICVPSALSGQCAFKKLPGVWSLLIYPAALQGVRIAPLFLILRVFLLTRTHMNGRQFFVEAFKFAPVLILAPALLLQFTLCVHACNF